MPVDQRPVLIMAGGTGGHIYPALAVAQRLLDEGVPVVWLGTRKGLEARVIPANNIPIEWLSIGGLRGKSKLTLLLAPFKLALACLQAMSVLRRLKPRCVLGMGGFASGPGGLMASVMGIPLVVHEQNAIAGLTNRKLAGRANAVLEAFPDTFAAAVEARHTGNPVRREIIQVAQPEDRLRTGGDPLRLLIVGGSLGAQALNEIVPQALARVDAELRPLVRHQAGSSKHQEAIAAYRAAGVEAQVDAFIEDMAAAYTWADLVICRAGAMTIAELAAAGVAAILVPYPHAVDDHQNANALYLAREQAAVLIQQRELEPVQLADWITDFARNREKLLAMAQRARELGKPDATELVAEELLRQGSKV